MSEDPVTSTGGTDGAALPGQDDRPVGTLELFFDLVFVYAMSQVTNLMLGDISWVGFGHGALALAAIWWAWVCFAWLTGTSDEAGPLTRTLILLAMAAMLVTAIALPEAFGGHALTFGLAYLGVRLLHVVLFVHLSRRDAELRAAVGRLIPTLLTGPAFVVVAAFVAQGVRRALLARDAYSYLHLPLVGGIVFFALGVHEAIAHPDQPLAPLTALALCGGVALFFAGDVAYRWRDHHQIAVDRLVAAAAAVVVIPLAVMAPSLVTLFTLTAVCALRTGWEIWHPPAIGPTAPAS